MNTVRRRIVWFVGRDIILFAAFIIFCFRSSDVLSSQLEVYCNQGGPLGVDIRNGSILMFGTVIVVVLYAFRSRVQSSVATLGIFLVVGGGLSNLIDRALFGCVRDFLLIKGLPAFNVADVALTVGGILAVFSIWEKPKTDRPDVVKII